MDATNKQVSSEALADVVLRVEELQEELLTANNSIERAFKLGFSVGYSMNADPSHIDEYWESVQDIILATEGSMPTCH